MTASPSETPVHLIRGLWHFGPAILCALGVAWNLIFGDLATAVHLTVFGVILAHSAATERALERVRAEYAEYRRRMECDV